MGILDSLLPKKRSVNTQQKTKTVQMTDVPTLSDKRALSYDANRDGMPDYLQREHLPSIVKQVSDTALAHVDAQREVERILMDWRGYEFDPKKNCYKPVSPPMINEVGVRQLGQIFHTVVNKLVMNSNITLEWAHEQTMKLSVMAVDWLEDNHQTWQVASDDLTPISEQIDALIYFILSRAINDGQRSHDTQRMKLTGDIKQQNPSI